MTFVCDLINGIKVPTDEYNKRLENLDVKKMQQQFATRINAVINKK